MSFTRYLTTLALFLTVTSAFEGVGKRGLFERQTCSIAGYIPACPGKLPGHASGQEIPLTDDSTRFLQVRSSWGRLL